MSATGLGVPGPGAGSMDVARICWQAGLALANRPASGTLSALAPAATRFANRRVEAGISGAAIGGETLKNREPRRLYARILPHRAALRSGHDPAGVVLARAMP